MRAGCPAHGLVLTLLLCTPCCLPPGLLELSSAVVFCRPSALAALTGLQRLAVSLIPMPSLAALNKLPFLHSLVLQQAQPLARSQCSSLARCQGLSSLSLSSVQWADLVQLAPLTSLSALSVQVRKGGVMQEGWQWWQQLERLWFV